MVHPVTQETGLENIRQPEATNPLLPAIRYQGLPEDSFEYSGQGAGQGTQQQPKGFFARLIDPFKNMVKDAFGLPKAVFNSLLRRDPNGGKPPGNDLEILPKTGFKSGNLMDETMPPPLPDNPFLAKQGVMSANLLDEGMPV